MAAPEPGTLLTGWAGYDTSKEVYYPAPTAPTPNNPAHPLAMAQPACSLYFRVRRHRPAIR